MEHVMLTEKIAELTRQLELAQRTIAHQQQQLAQLIITDWPKLIRDLNSATSPAGAHLGFADWMGRSCKAATETPDPEDGTIAARAVADLVAAADRGDRITVIQNYMQLREYLTPSVAELTAWQAALDSQDPPIPANLLSFPVEELG